MDIRMYALSFEAKYAAAYLLNDPAHRENHFREVMDNMLSIMEVVDVGVEGTSAKRMAVAAAYLHDLFAWSRENHHNLSHEFVRSSQCELLADFTPEEREMVALACLEHRASFKGEFSNIFSAAFNAADLGPPDVMEDVSRAYTYARAKQQDLSREQAVQVAIEHMVDKFGRTGYARRSDIYILSYGVQLEEYFTAIEGLNEMDLTPDDLERIAALN